MPDDLAQQVAEGLAQQVREAVARVRARPTATMADTSVLTGRSLNRCYMDARERGEVAGIPVIRLSEKSIRLPSRPLLRLVGLDQDDPEGTDHEA